MKTLSAADAELPRPADLPGRDVIDCESITLAGRRARVSVIPKSGALAIWLDNRMVTKLETGLGAADQASETPLGFDRVIGTVSERIFVPRDQPAVVLQWSTTSPRAFDLRFDFVNEIALAQTELTTSQPVEWRNEGTRATALVNTHDLTLVIALPGETTPLRAQAAVRVAQYRRQLARGLQFRSQPSDQHIEQLLWLAPPLLDSARDEPAIALALLALGDESAARDILAAADRRAPNPELHALLAARYLAATGDIAMVRSAWPLLRKNMLAEPAGYRAIAAELRTVAESIGESANDLPIGNAAVDVPALVKSGMSHLPDAVASAASSVLGLVEHVIGSTPDASRQRLRLAPRFRDEWQKVDIENLRSGAAAIRMAYEREENRHRFELRPTEGQVPIRLIFEPVLAGRLLLSAGIDGAPATLNARSTDAGLVCPVQVVLDHDRTVFLEVAP